MCNECTSNQILVDINPECLGDLWSDSAAAKARVALLQLHDNYRLQVIVTNSPHTSGNITRWGDVLGASYH